MDNNANTDLVGPSAWVWRALILATLGVLVLTASFTILHRPATPASVDQVRQITETLAQRGDCRSAINSQLQDVKDKRFNLVLTLLFEPRPIGTPLTPEESKAIQDVNANVNDLPSLATAVLNGATINGVHFAPCPKVAK